ncbi:MAG: DUF1566 domain-containing protein [Leptospiraceae bacterium]|nr:DUF1566 domain-containing protein [Leptospiraceae bacterium]
MYFPANVNDLYWTSTEFASNTNNAWGVNFSNANTSNGLKTITNYVRCVSQ